MITSEQLAQISSFVRDYLFQSAAASAKDWLKRFPRAAEHRWRHTLNVLKNAETILAGEEASPESAEIVRAAVYLHDVSMFVCDHEIHGQVSAEIAEDYLPKIGVAPQAVARVVKAIAEHGTDLGDMPPDEQGAHFSWEGKVVLEADILDKLGAATITGGLLFLGARGILTHEAHEALSNGSTMERARIFKDYIWTATGKKLAEQRFTFFLRFLDQLKEETHDPLDETAGAATPPGLPST
ncbi:MAG: HD domain-containing protein [Chloroflexi bacterium]|nr:HD domain-containing protein [Chloroflexota bacterium]